jgi:class 3 adenylate cyclase
MLKFADELRLCRRAAPKGVVLSSGLWMQGSAEGVTAPSAALDALLARHGPADGVRQLGPAALEDLQTRGSTPVEAAVVVGDLRMSAFVLKEAVRPALYARFIIGFTEAVRSLANARQGWFDKFTGDGFVAFWLEQPGASPGVTLVPPFCQALMPAAETLISNLRRNSRNFPVGVGLSLGVDSGPCELVKVGDSLTVVGSPIVGATRMVSCARARQTLVNVYLGEALEHAQDRFLDAGVRVERTSVKTKEYPEGQEAFEQIGRAHV